MLQRKFQILLIEDLQLVRMVLIGALENDDIKARGLFWERNVVTASDGAEGLEKAKSLVPDLILLDIVMQGMDGFEVLAELKKASETRDIPVIVITSLGDEKYEEKGLTLGAVDYIQKPINEKVALSRVAVHQKIVEQMRKIEYESLYDSLTSVFNRRFFDMQSELLWEYCARELQHIGALIIDVDNFKAFNEKYGHAQGDIALQMLAKSLTVSKRRTVDKVFRWGSEEFAVILPGSDLSSSLKVAEMFRSNIENLAIPHIQTGEPLSITASIGVASVFSDENSSFGMLVREADKALYVAKETGKNKVHTLQSA